MRYGPHQLPSLDRRPIGHVTLFLSLSYYRAYVLGAGYPPRLDPSSSSHMSLIPCKIPPRLTSEFFEYIETFVRFGGSPVRSFGRTVLEAEGGEISREPRVDFGGLWRDDEGVEGYGIRRGGWRCGSKRAYGAPYRW